MTHTTTQMRRTLWLAVVLATLGLGIGGNEAVAKKAPPVDSRGAIAGEKLVTANWNYQTDSKGFRWDIVGGGYISRGTNYCFSSAMYLQINNYSFSQTHSHMTSDRKEFVLVGNRGGIQVTRRIRVDHARGGARYLDVFTNLTGHTQMANIRIYGSVYSTAQQIVTNKGRPFFASASAYPTPIYASRKSFRSSYVSPSIPYVQPSSGGVSPFKKNEYGILAMQRPSYNRPSAMLIVTSHRAKVKPHFYFSGNRTFYINYGISLKPNETKSVVHVVAQRQASTVNPSNVKKEFAQFVKYGRLIKPMIPKGLERTVINFPISGGGGEGRLASVKDIASAVGISNLKTAVLVLSPESRVVGSLDEGQFGITTRFGKAIVPAKDVAMFIGGGGQGRTMQVHLRDGQVLVGNADVSGVKFKARIGASIELKSEDLAFVLGKPLPTDGKALAGSKLLLLTHWGDRVALAPGSGDVLPLITPWGELRVPFSQLKSLTYRQDPHLRAVVELLDGSKIDAVLPTQPIKVASVRFGQLELRSMDIASISGVAGKTAGAAAKASGKVNLPPHCKLAGDVLIVGKIDLTALSLKALTSKNVLDNSMVVKLQRIAHSKEGGQFTRGPDFNVTLTKTGTKKARFNSFLIPINTAYGTLMVRATDIVSADFKATTIKVSTSAGRTSKGADAKSRSVGVKVVGNSFPPPSSGAIFLKPNTPIQKLLPQLRKGRTIVRPHHPRP